VRPAAPGRHRDHSAALSSRAHAHPNPLTPDSPPQIQTVNVKSLGAEYELQDGERLPLAVKDLGACDLYPQSLRHNPNGRFVTVCGDGE
jgi:hypothetical protein